MTMSSFFSGAESDPDSSSMLAFREYLKDQREEKVLLARRYYTPNAALYPTTPSFVKEAYLSAAEMVAKDQTHLAYLPPLGDPKMGEACARLLLGKDSTSFDDGLVVGAQTAGGGTGALRFGAEFLSRRRGHSRYYLSTQTWSAHHNIFQSAGLEESCPHRYLSLIGGKEVCSLDLEGMVEDLEGAQEGALVILHTSAHNPTGVDPSKEDWLRLASVFSSRRLLAFFDCAFAGFASGSVEEDFYPVRLWDSLGLEFLAAQCFSKNMGLTNERVGHLTVRVKDRSLRDPLASQIATVARWLYSSPPAHGALVVTSVLSNPRLREGWDQHVRTIHDTIVENRRLLRSNLEKLDEKKRDWSFVTETKGMFLLLDMTEEQIRRLKVEKAVYATREFKINLFGLLPSNAERVARSLLETEED